MKIRQGCWGIAGLVVLVGCQTAATRREANRIPLSESKSAVAADNRKPKSDFSESNVVTKVAAESADDSQVPVSPAVESVVPTAIRSEMQAQRQSLTLQDAVAVALFQNPDLVALRGQEGVSQAALGVAETYPWNPFVQAQYFPNGRPFVRASSSGGSSGASNYYVWVMQRFELAHQRRYRTEAASATLNQVRWSIQQGELLNIAQTTRLYFSALYQQDLRNLAHETNLLNAKLLGVLERRYKAGLATAAEVTTARVAARQAKQQEQFAEATYQAALLALRQQLNLSLGEPLELTDRLGDYQWLPVQNLESPDVSVAVSTGQALSLASELASARPDVMAACAGVMVTNANASLARAAMVPDIQSGPIYETVDDGTTFLGLRLQMDIPVWNSGRPLAEQRRAEACQQALTYEQLRTRAALEAQMAIDRHERARRIAEGSTVDLRPFSEQMPPDLREMMSQFEAGQADVLAVFVTQNNLIQERRTYLDLLNELAQSAAVVIQTTALPLDRLIILRTQP